MKSSPWECSTRSRHKWNIQRSRAVKARSKSTLAKKDVVPLIIPGVTRPQIEYVTPFPKFELVETRKLLR
jgi:hypothetical protein